jgi:hypothetical protein
MISQPHAASIATKTNKVICKTILQNTLNDIKYACQQTFMKIMKKILTAIFKKNNW